MPNLTPLLLFSGLLTAFPLLSVAQTCNTNGLPATTPTSRYIRYDNGTVLDQDTGLMWKACSEGQAWNPAAHSCDLVATRYDKYEALKQADAVNNQGGFASFKDWRLPNIKELFTLVERQCRNPAINLAVFPNTGADDVVISSNYHFIKNDLSIDLSSGHDIFKYGAQKSLVRLVREQK